MATLASESTPQAKTIRRHFSDLVRAIQDPLMLAIDLYAKDIITRDIVSKVRELPGTKNDKASILMEAVSDHVSLRPEAFQEFLAILGKTQDSAAVKQVLQNMQQTGKPRQTSQDTQPSPVATNQGTRRKRQGTGSEVNADTKYRKLETAENITLPEQNALIEESTQTEMLIHTKEKATMTEMTPRLKMLVSEASTQTIHKNTQERATLTDTTAMKYGPVQTRQVNEASVDSRDEATMTEDCAYTKPTSVVVSTQTDNHLEGGLREEQPLAEPVDWDKAQINWETGPRTPEPIKRPAVIAVHGSKVYINGSGSEMIYEFDSTLNEWENRIECPCTNFALAVIKNSLTTVGGYEADPRTARGRSIIATKQLFSFELLPCQNSEWKKEFPPMSVARSNPEVVTTSQYLIVASYFRAEFQKSPSIFTEVLDIDKHQWYTTASINTGGTNPLKMMSWKNSQFLITSGSTGTLKSFTCRLKSFTQLCLAQGPRKPIVWQSFSEPPFSQVTAFDTFFNLNGYIAKLDRGYTFPFQLEFENDPQLSIYDSEKNSWKRIPHGGAITFFKSGVVFVALSNSRVIAVTIDTIKTEPSIIHIGSITYSDE